MIPTIQLRTTVSFYLPSVIVQLEESQDRRKRLILCDNFIPDHKLAILFFFCPFRELLV